MIIEAHPCPNKCGGYIAYRPAYEPDSNVPKLDENGTWKTEPYCPLCEGRDIICPTCGTQVRKEKVE